jgi:poly(beta-D-mannuronate) lyase
MIAPNALVIAGTLAMLAVGAASAKEFASPFADIQPKLKGKLDFTCEDAVPKAEVSLDVTSMYDQNDPSRSTIDDDQLEDYSDGMAPIRDYLTGLTRFTSNYVASNGVKAKYGICALVWLDAWSKGDALSDLQTRQAVLSSTRIVGGMAMAYLAVRPVAEATGYDDGPLKAWFAARAKQFISTYEESGDLGSNRSNHRYWGGYAVAAIGVVTGDRDLLEWGVESFRIGACQADANGALPLELDRKKKARDYHLVAVAPLVMTAELAAANGIDAYGICGGAIHRVIKFTLDSVEHPELIEELTGVKMQKLPTKNGFPRGDRFAWVEPYFKRFGGGEAQFGFELERPLYSSPLGGRVTVYAEAKPNAVK